MAIANTFQSLQPDLKESYSDGKKKKDRFKKTKSMLAPKGKATAELDASKDPMAALKDKSYLNLKGKRGIAV